MRRPNRTLCGIVLGLAVLVGCTKKPKTDTDSANASGQQAQPAPAPAQTEPGTLPPGTPPGPPPGRASMVYTAGGPVGPAGGVPVAGAPKTEGTPPAPSGTSGPVELVQCRFEKVDGALAAAKGKVVLVDCWARWCGPCLDTFPELVKKNEKYSAKGLVCMSVSIDSGRKAFNPDQVLAFLKQKNAAFPNFYLTDLGGDKVAMDKRLGQFNSIPYNVLFNKKGEKVWSGHPSSLTVGMLEAELAK